MFSTPAVKRSYEAYTQHVRHCPHCHRTVRCAAGTALVRAYLRETKLDLIR